MFYSWARHFGKISAELEENCRFFANIIIFSVLFFIAHTLRQHVDAVHRGIKPFVCNSCEYTSAFPHHLRRHIEIVHEGKRPFKCETCNKDYTAQQHLQIHIDSFHEGKKPFQCSKCHARYMI